MEECEIGKGGEGFIDRSKVRILLCDNDSKSSEEVFTLLCRCSYQVTSVKSPRQVIDALNAEGPDIDIILSEVDLPMSKGLKLLKYIMRDRDLRRIPVIMMSAQDEVSVVVKCLKFGAADYLVKPLRTNELLNLWTHMWRRRRTLGLAEKNIMNYDIDVAVSDPSDANTNSTTLFSDDTDERSRKSANPEACTSTHQEEEIAPAAINKPPLETVFGVTTQCLPDVPGISDRRTGHFTPFPRKNELKIGESSAFFTYVKSDFPKMSSQDAAPILLQESVPRPLIAEEKVDEPELHVIPSYHGQSSGVAYDNYAAEDCPSNNSTRDSFSVDRSSTPSFPLEFSQPNSSEFSQVPHDFPGFQQHPTYPYYIPGVMNQVHMMPQQQMTQQHMYNHMPQCPPQMQGMAPFPYFPLSICLQSGQIPPTHPWPSYGNPSSVEGNTSKTDRREAALMKFRQKRKERCFDKKIRYANRKKLAERRPRVRGQFVRKVNGINVDLNGLPGSVDNEDDEDEDEEEEEQLINLDSSPDDDGSMSIPRR